jgi:hypothetical protein
MTFFRAFILAASLAFCGCEQMREAQWQKAYNEKRATALRNGWIPAQTPRYMAPKPRFREDTPPMMAGGGPTIIPVPMMIDPAPAPAPMPQSAPQPIIFTGGGGGGTTIATRSGNSTIVSRIGGWNPGTTIATQSGGTTVVSQFGGGPPIGAPFRPYSPPVYPVGFGY